MRKIMRWLKNVHRKSCRSLFRRNMHVRINSLNLVGLAFDWLSESLLDLCPISACFIPFFFHRVLSFLHWITLRFVNVHLFYTSRMELFFFSCSILVAFHFPAFPMLSLAIYFAFCFSVSVYLWPLIKTAIRAISLYISSNLPSL